MKVLIFIICIIALIALNIIWFYRGVKHGMEHGMKYSLDKTYDVFMLAIYAKLRKDNKSEEEANKFMHDVHDLLITELDKVE